MCASSPPTNANSARSDRASLSGFVYRLRWSVCATCSIHKSQGLTLPSLEVELASCFEAGQAYVALSRAVSLQSTRILSFNPRRVTTNQAVHEFYQAIESEQEQDLAREVRDAAPRSSDNLSPASPHAYSASYDPMAAASSCIPGGGASSGAGARTPLSQVPSSLLQPLPRPSPVAPSQQQAGLSQPADLTVEQRRRIEANKLAALEKRRLSTASTASTASMASVASSYSGGWSPTPPPVAAPPPFTGATFYSHGHRTGPM